MVSEAFEFEFRGEYVRSGTRLRFKNDRKVYRFRSLFYDSVFNEEWVEVLDGSARIKRFHPSKIRSVVINKKSRRGKEN